MPTYTVNFSVSGFKKMGNKLDQLEKILTSKEIYEYIAEKCMKILNEITIERLSTYSKEDIDTSYYASRHQYKIEGSTIYIFNDSKIDISSKNMSEITKAKYPAQLSLAKIVEYGIGYTGANFTLTPDGSPLPNDNWEYDINNHGSKGWYYTDEKGEVVWTNGFAGRLIFNELAVKVKKNARRWVTEYVRSKIK